MISPSPGRFRQINCLDLNLQLSFGRHICFNPQYSWDPAAQWDILHFGRHFQAESGSAGNRLLPHINESFVPHAFYDLESFILIINNQHLSGDYSLIET